MRIIKKYLPGDEHAANFLPLINRRVKANRDTIQKSLQGNWRNEHLFILEQNYELCKTYKQRIEVYDLQIENQLQQYEASRNEGIIKTTKEKKEIAYLERKLSELKNSAA